MSSANTQYTFDKVSKNFIWITTSYSSVDNVCVMLNQSLLVKHVNKGGSCWEYSGSQFHCLPLKWKLQTRWHLVSREIRRANPGSSSSSVIIGNDELERAIGYHSADQPSFSEICNGADGSLFRAISTNPKHPLHKLLPPKVVRQYDLSGLDNFSSIPTKGNSSLYQTRTFPKDSFLRTRIDLLMTFLKRCRIVCL